MMRPLSLGSPAHPTHCRTPQGLHPCVLWRTEPGAGVGGSSQPGDGREGSCADRDTSKAQGLPCRLKPAAVATFPLPPIYPTLAEPVQASHSLSHPCPQQAVPFPCHPPSPVGSSLHWAQCSLPQRALGTVRSGSWGQICVHVTQASELQGPLHMPTPCHILRKTPAHARCLVRSGPAHTSHGCMSTDHTWDPAPRARAAPRPRPP